MDTQEIWTALTHGLFGPVVGVAIGLFLLYWRRYRKLGAYRLRDEALRVLGMVVPIAVGALIQGARWPTVLVMCLSAFAGALGLNSKPLGPVTDSQPVESKAPKPNAITYDVRVNGVEGVVSAFEAIRKAADEAAKAAEAASRAAPTLPPKAQDLTIEVDE